MTFSKALAAGLGSFVSMLALWGLPVPEFMNDPSVQMAFVTLATVVFTYFAPANKTTV
jgi:hypothetical protein